MAGELTPPTDPRVYDATWAIVRVYEARTGRSANAGFWAYARKCAIDAVALLDEEDR